MAETGVSIHLMLLFIGSSEPNLINCWIVSIHLMLLFIFHPLSVQHHAYEFQYISCYSLSVSGHFLLWWTSVSIHLMLLFIGSGLLRGDVLLKFQYISCYSLSPCHDPLKEAWRVSIHLMLLFIWFLRLLLFFDWCFNTSHVTLYRFICIVFTASWSVSIHLMLLFIIQTSNYRIIKSQVSIHLMLLFIAFPLLCCDG